MHGWKIAWQEAVVKALCKQACNGNTTFSLDGRDLCWLRSKSHDFHMSLFSYVSNLQSSGTSSIHPSIYLHFIFYHLRCVFDLAFLICFRAFYILTWKELRDILNLTILIFTQLIACNNELYIVKQVKIFAPFWNTSLCNLYKMI